MKNKGFTLIELLAVIVILAIIALIAIPMISKIIDKTEDSAVLRSAELYIDGVNQSIMRANLADKIRPKECIIQEDGNLICDGEYEIKIEATGTKPIAGTLVIEDRAVKSFTGMVLDIYKLEMNEKGKIVVVEKIEEEKEPEDYVDATGARVQLSTGLTPVVYSEDSWKVANLKEKWYDYTSQEWANAVILKSGVTKEVGDIIDVTTEIKGMFVYVPRYEYKIEGTYGTHTNGTAGVAATPGKIDVNFLSNEITEASSGYRIHPAFTFGETELNGIWVGKFETTGTAAAPTVLPNVKTLVSQNVNTQYTTAQVFNTYLNDTSLDAHMAKNSEWGAAAYLSQSKYGKYGNNTYTGANKEVMINNCSNMTTGAAANSYSESYNTSTCTANTYVTAKGQAASTTGNITGIYDMSGGADEYTMGVYNKAAGSSGISFSNIDDKYYDNYGSTAIASACNSGICYGHALSETQGWYSDSSSFITTSSSYVWLLRGGNYSGTTTAGIFGFSRYNGKARTTYSFRIAITAV